MTARRLAGEGKCEIMKYRGGKTITAYNGDYLNVGQFLSRDNFGTVISTCSISHCSLALFYGDLPYGLKLAPGGWDDACLTLKELTSLLTALSMLTTSEFYVTWLWVNVTQIAIVTEALLATNHDNVQTFYWHKVDNRPNVPAHRLCSLRLLQEICLLFLLHFSAF